MPWQDVIVPSYNMVYGTLVLMGSGNLINFLYSYVYDRYNIRKRHSFSAENVVYVVK
jgi:hypothetical protein